MKHTKYVSVTWEYKRLQPRRFKGGGNYKVSADEYKRSLLRSSVCDGIAESALCRHYLEAVSPRRVRALQARQFDRELETLRKYI